MVIVIVVVVVVYVLPLIRLDNRYDIRQVSRKNIKQ
jgi:hypothetical protein